jgi:hypothetical protein
MTEKGRKTAEQLADNVRRVLDHYLQDELKDYRQTPRDQQPGHIYRSLRGLKAWLETGR